MLLLKSIKSEDLNHLDISIFTFYVINFSRRTDRNTGINHCPADKNVPIPKYDFTKLSDEVDIFSVMCVRRFVDNELYRQ